MAARRTKKQPNLASAGFSVLVAGGYTPLCSAHNVQFPSATVGAFSSSSPAPLHEFATCYEGRGEACMAIRESGLMQQRQKEEAGNGGARKRQSVDGTKLLAMRNWVRQLIDRSENEVPAHQVAQLRALLQGAPLDAASSHEPSSAPSPAGKQVVTPAAVAVDLETCDWSQLVSVARKQLEEVFDPFLKKHNFV